MCKSVKETVKNLFPLQKLKKKQKQIVLQFKIKEKGKQNVFLKPNIPRILREVLPNKE